MYFQLSHAKNLPDLKFICRIEDKRARGKSPSILFPRFVYRSGYGKKNRAASFLLAWRP